MHAHIKRNGVTSHEFLLLEIQSEVAAALADFHLRSDPPHSYSAPLRIRCHRKGAVFFRSAGLRSVFLQYPTEASKVNYYKALDKMEMA